MVGSAAVQDVEVELGRQLEELEVDNTHSFDP